MSQRHPFRGRYASLSLFSNCSKRELDALDQYGTLVDVKPGRVLSHADASFAALVVLVEGRAALRPAVGTYEVLGRGAVFGDAVRRATVVASTEATVLVFGRRELRALVEDMPSVAAALRAIQDAPEAHRTRTHTPRIVWITADHPSGVA